MDTLIAVNPKGRLKDRSSYTRKVPLLRPAILTSDEVEELLGHFSGDALQAMQLLIVGSLNEPHSEVSTLSYANGKVTPLFSNRLEIAEILRRVEVNGRRFYLLGHYPAFSGGTRVSRQYQLWEVGK